MTFAPSTLVLVLSSFAVGALFGWVLQRTSSRQAVNRLRQAMTREVTRLQDRLDQCTEDLTAETRSLGQARNQGEELRSALAASESECVRLEEQLARMAALETTVERLTSGIRASADELRRLRISNNEKARALDALQTSASEMGAELRATQLTLNETTRSLSEAQAQNGRLEEGLAVARRVADVAREQVDALAVAEQRVRKLETEVRTLRFEKDRNPAYGSRPVLVPVPDPFAAPRLDARADAGETADGRGSSTPRPGARSAAGKGVNAAATNDGQEEKEGQTRRQPDPGGSQGDAAAESTDGASPTGAAGAAGAAGATGAAGSTREQPLNDGTATPGQDGAATEERGQQPLPLEQLVDVLGAGVREMARRWDQAMSADADDARPASQRRDSFDRLDEKMRKEAMRFARRLDETESGDEPRPARSLFERLLGEVLDEVRRERRR